MSKDNTNTTVQDEKKQTYEALGILQTPFARRDILYYKNSSSRSIEKTMIE